MIKLTEKIKYELSITIDDWELIIYKIRKYINLYCKKYSIDKFSLDVYDDHRINITFFSNESDVVRKMFFDNNKVYSVLHFKGDKCVFGLSSKSLVNINYKWYF